MEKTSEVLSGCMEKIKVSSAEIVVHGTKDKPYYEIKYRDLSDGQIHEGYSSYNLDYVFGWLKECFEIMPEKGADRMSISEQVKELREYADGYKKSDFGVDGIVKILYQAADTIESISAKLADKERSAEDCGGEWIYCGDGKNMPVEHEFFESIAVVGTKRHMLSDLLQVTVYDMDKDEYFVSDDCTSDGKWCNFDSEQHKVLAWMPLPKPYHEPSPTAKNAASHTGERKG